MSLPELKKKAMNEFDKKFASVKETDAHYYNPWLRDVKSFLDSHLEEAYEVGKKDAENEKLDPLIKTYLDNMLCVGCGFKKRTCQEKCSWYKKLKQ